MKALVAAMFCLMATSAPAVASERFAPDNPWFQDFEKTCRVGQFGLDPTCEGSVNGAFAEHAKVAVDKVTCDFSAFWRAKDADHDDRFFAVLPWQYGVEFIVAEPGVCRTIPPPTVTGLSPTELSLLSH